MPRLPRLRRSVAGLVVAALAATVGLTGSSTATPNPVTPGPFLGYGFDQCEAPSQTAMDAWAKSSPFHAVGIYIAGALRFCQAQTNLTPTWVSTQLAHGWRLLPITLGRQAACTTRDRYQKLKISADPTNTYYTARSQGVAEANGAVAAAKRLGISPQSILFYDLEGFPTTSTTCKQSALWFLHAWTVQVHALGYRSGVYSSAASGMRVLDDARVTAGNKAVLPDVIWIADWDGKAGTQSRYIRSDGWPGRRLKQYRGGHQERWGGVTINIDSNYIDLRGLAPAPSPTKTAPSSLADPKCTTASISRPAYRYALPGLRPGLVVPLQCLLKQQRLYTIAVTGVWNAQTTTALHAFQHRLGHPAGGIKQSEWMTLLTAGTSRTTLRYGSRGADVIRLQRALNAAMAWRLTVSGRYDARTRSAVTAYQRRVGIRRTGVVASLTWSALVAGRR